MSRATFWITASLYEFWLARIGGEAMNQIGEVLRRRANEIAKSSGTYTEKSDHHESVELALTRRTDLPSDRLPLFDKMKAEIAALQKENEELQQSIKKQVSAWRTSDECKAKLHQERDREIIGDRRLRPRHDRRRQVFETQIDYPA